MENHTLENVEAILCGPLDSDPPGLRAGRLLEETKCFHAAFLIIVEDIIIQKENNKKRCQAKG